MRIFGTLEQESEKKENGIEKKSIYILCILNFGFGISPRLQVLGPDLFEILFCEFKN
jgi:hypothetical protein